MNVGRYMTKYVKNESIKIMNTKNFVIKDLDLASDEPLTGENER